VDIASIERLRQAVERTPRFLVRVFSETELAHCAHRKDPYPSLAACWAAREALRKVHPVFVAGTSFRDVEVIHDDRGRPGILLSPELTERACKSGMRSLDLSLSHDHDKAIAMVVAEWEGG
jgi:holo-[acyl-carrier protein] synthase